VNAVIAFRWHDGQTKDQQAKECYSGMDETTVEEPIRFGQEFTQDPHSLYRRLRPGSPACPVILPNNWPGWVVTSYSGARLLLADPRVSKDVTQALRLFPPGTAGGYASEMATHLLNSDPPEHTQLRRLVGKVFTGRAVERLRPRIEQAADDLLDAFPVGETVDLLDAYALPLPITVICELIGVPIADQQDFRSWTLPFVTMATNEEKAAANRLLAAYLTQLIGNKKANPTSDLLSELIHASDESGRRLSPSETLSMVFLLLIAGFETTVNLIANGVLALLRHPGQLALLRSDPSLLPGAIEEILRFDGPVNLATLRYTAEPVRAGQAEIPADQLVHVALLAANRDSHRFPDPDTFDITRPSGGHVAFGHGIHHCLGAPLARLEGQIAIGGLFSRFPDITLDADPGTLRWRDSTLMHGLESLPVRVGS
jgi:cytochrome P450